MPVLEGPGALFNLPLSLHIHVRKAEKCSSLSTSTPPTPRQESGRRWRKYLIPLRFYSFPTLAQWARAFCMAFSISVTGQLEKSTSSSNSAPCDFGENQLSTIHFNLRTHCRQSPTLVVPPRGMCCLLKINVLVSGWLWNRFTLKTQFPKW